MTGDPDADGTEDGTDFLNADVVPTDVRRRRRWVPALVTVLVLALATAGGLFWWQQQAGTPADAPVSALQDQTLYLSFTTQDGRSAGGLLFIGRDRDAYGVLVPADLTLDVAQVGTTTVRQAQLVGPDAPGQALSDATAVPVDGHWVLSFEGLAALVDAVGGVTVDVDVPVRAGEVSLVPGEQELTGPQAATYAGWSQNDEAPVGQLVRSGQVIHAVLAELPADPAGITAALAEADGVTTLEPDELADVLARMRSAQTEGTFGGSLLPTSPAPTPTDPQAVALDLATFSEWIGAVAPDLQVHEPGTAGRVRVLNASAVGGTADPARGLLLGEGFAHTYGGTAEPVQPTSLVLFSPARDTGARAIAAAQALGLDPSAVRSSNEIPVGQDIVVLLGEDFAVSHGLAVPLTADEPAEDPADADAADGEQPSAEDPGQ